MPIGHYARPPLDIRFWVKVDQSAGSGACWPWMGATTPKGYGKIGSAGKTIYAHRLALELHLGRPLGVGLLACHINECNSPSCCNPTHLYEGTYTDNSKDRTALGHGVGENSTTDLKEQDIHDIRAHQGTYIDIAAAYGISVASVSYIKNLVNWSHLPVKGPVYIGSSGSQIRYPCSQCGQGVDPGNYERHVKFCDGSGPRRRRKE